MQVLIIKSSSMGDLIHTLPALTDAGKAIPAIRFDWVAEQSFAEIPLWHPQVERVIPVTLRRWRQHPWQSFSNHEFNQFHQALRLQSYDLIIDAQGLIKSSVLACFAKGRRVGLGFRSVREAWASLLYHQRYAVNPKLHAVERTRLLFSKALGYELNTKLDYGIQRNKLPSSALDIQKPYLMFMHGTTWATKHWPEAYWEALLKLATEAGFKVLLPWGNEAERERAQRLANYSTAAQVLPKLSLSDLASLIADAYACVSVDTGLGHLAAALGTPNISLYGPTHPALTGTVGERQVHLSAQFPCAPCLQKVCTYTQASSVQPACFGSITPEQVFAWLEKIEEL